MLIIWSDDADNDMAEILAYFSGIDKEEIGLEIVSDIFSSTDRLVDYPLSGRAGRLSNTRELVSNSFPYVVIYRISADSIHILGVIHRDCFLKCCDFINGYGEIVYVNK